MLEAVLNRQILRMLYERSSFKKAQLDSLLVKRHCDAHGIRFKNATVYKDKKTSLGSMARSASQAEGVLSRSAASLILGLCLDLVPLSMVEAIPKVAGILKQPKTPDLSEEELEQFLSLIDAMLHQASHK